MTFIEKAHLLKDLNTVLMNMLQGLWFGPELRLQPFFSFLAVLVSSGIFGFFPPSNNMWKKNISLARMKTFSEDE